MKTLCYDEQWPDTWKYSFPYDEMEIYGRVSPKYLGYAYAYEKRRNIAINLIREVLPIGARILDVAAAQGNFTLSLAEMGYRVTWNDIREELIEYVKLKHEFGEVDFRPGNVFELDVDCAFDGILITEIIEHVAHPDDFLRRISMLVKPGGYIVMTTPNGAYIRNPLPRFSDCPNPESFEEKQFMPNSDGHIFLLWPDEVVTLATKAGLVVEKVNLFNTPLKSGHMKMSKILPYTPKFLVDSFEAVASCLPHSLSMKVHAHTAARYVRPFEEKR